MKKVDDRHVDKARPYPCRRKPYSCGYSHWVKAMKQEKFDCPCECHKTYNK